MKTCTLIAAILTFVWGAAAYSSGAPPRTCIDLTPRHEGGRLQTSYPPYQVLPAAGQGRVRLILGSPQGLAYGGFFILATDVNTGELVGEFANLPENAKFVECVDGIKNAVTHTSPEDKRNLEFDWIAPANYDGTIVFNSTFAQDYSTYWVGVESPKVNIHKRSIDILTSPTPLTTPKTTTPPYYNVENNVQDSTPPEDPFYEGCATRKNCFGLPDDCTNTRNCKVAVAVEVQGDKYFFEMQTQKGKYVAVGLSRDNKMGDDSVVECVDENGEVKLYASWNNGRKNSRQNLQTGNVKLESSSIRDGVITCRFSRDKHTKIQAQEFDLVNTAFYLLLASGSDLKSNGVDYHDLERGATGEARLLSDVGVISAASNVLIHVHGALMITAWMATASIGIIVARYYRQTWVNSQFCGKDHWFAWHRILMLLTWTMTLAAIVVIFVEIGDWSSETIHASVGIASTALCFVQPFMAAMRPHPGAAKRQLFNWVHWFVGNAAQILAIVAIFFAVRVNKAKLPEWVDWILVAYVVFHVLTHVILTFLSLAPDREAIQRGDTFPMKDMSSRGAMSHPDARIEAPRAGLRKLILGIYIVAVVLFVASLIIIVVLAPIEEWWSSFTSSLANY